MYTKWSFNTNTLHAFCRGNPPDVAGINTLSICSARSMLEVCRSMRGAENGIYRAIYFSGEVPAAGVSKVRVRGRL